MVGGKDNGSILGNILQPYIMDFPIGTIDGEAYIIK
jgi:hypothetical protein